jgi:hypothetical protein
MKTSNTPSTTPLAHRASRVTIALGRKRFDDCNVRHFDGRLPQFRIATLRAGAPAFCDVTGQTVYLPVDVDDLDAAVLHEMIHVVTDGEHDAAFLSELSRIADAGDCAARRELAREDWHAAGVRFAKKLALRVPYLESAEVCRLVTAKVGRHPDGLDNLFPIRALNAWKRARRDGAA